MRNFCIYLIIFFWYGYGHTISRVGNGFTAGELTADLPSAVFDVRESQSQRLALFMAVPRFVTFNLGPQVITIGDFKTEYPEFAELSAENVWKTLQSISSRKWEKRDHACFVEFFTTHQSTRTQIIMWGVSEGIVIISPNSKIFEKSVKQILDSARFRERQCRP